VGSDDISREELVSELGETVRVHFAGTESSARV
jgi:hypothetical protein